MIIEKRKKKLLSSVRTTSSLASLIIISGYLLIILSATVGSLHFQSDISGKNVDVILNTLAPDSEPTATDRGKIKNSTISLEAIKASVNAQKFKFSISSFIASLDWSDVWKLLATAFLILWLGYMLRVISILTETQLIDYQNAG